MESNTENRQLESATRALKARMAKAATLHLEQIDARTSIVLQIAGVLKRGAAPVNLPASVLEIVNDATHPLRVRGKLGPFILYQEATTPNQTFVLDIVTVLLSTGVTSRAAAVSHLETIAMSESATLTSKTQRLLREKRAQILDDNAAIWQPAALEVHDAVAEDLLYQLAAVEQSLEAHFEEGLREYFSKVLRPSVYALEGLELNIVKPSEQKVDILNVVRACAERSDLQDACDEYFRLAGFIPLADEYSLTRVVELWQARHSSAANLWEILWDWANDTRSPLARYHVCNVFLTKPEWRSQGQERVLWQEILEIISHSSIEDDTLKWRHEWTIRKELAQHYLHFLESRSPGALGEPLACFAWWLAEKIATLVGRSAEVSSRLRNVAIIPEAASSDFVWKLSLPRIAPSVLGKATHLGASPWALSALIRITSQTLTTLSPGLDEQTANRFERCLAAVVMFGFPLQAAQHADMVYPFETTLSDPISAWRGYREGPTGADTANGLASMYAKLSNTAEIVPALQKIYEEDEANQMIIAFWAKSLALQGALPQKEVLKFLSDAEWRRLAFTKIIDAALDQLFLAFSLASNSNDKVWNARLSHLYALACEDIGDNAERRRILFAFTALSGLHTYSVSALQRLLTGNQRATYLELLSTLRNALSTNRNNPAWLTARIRAVLAAIAPA
jgi:hypothetical protein